MVACAGAADAQHAQAQSPESFMARTYGWTVRGLDSERSSNGRFRAFACFEDRLAPPVTAADFLNHRWGTQCRTVRDRGENLEAMLYVTWVNPRFSNPVTTAEYEREVAKIMAGGKSGSEPRCVSTAVLNGNSRMARFDCEMVLPFGTYYASFLQFEHRGIEYYLRAQNASVDPVPHGPPAAIDDILPRIVFTE
jgi:hypothetical protein